MPNVPKQSTHWETCWQVHDGCAASMYCDSKDEVVTNEVKLRAGLQAIADSECCTFYDCDMQYDACCCAENYAEHVLKQVYG